MSDVYSCYRTLARTYSKNIPEILALKRGCYPEFVLEQNPDALHGEIPVFTFHSVEPDAFERQLDFLSVNGYRTLTSDELYDCLVGGRAVPERAVVLTFDDGWRSVWTVAYPLLKRYGFRGVCFLVPGLIDDDDAYRPDLEDVRRGKAGPDAAVGRDIASEPLCTWQEITAMHGDGTLDFQSHSMFHHLIFTSSVIVDFIHPFFDFYLKNFNVPLLRCKGDDNIAREEALGTPIYAHAPRLSGKKRYFDDEGLREACIRYVKQEGEADFFKTPAWRKELSRVVTDYREHYGDGGRFESDEEQEETLYADLLDSKRTIEKRLQGKSVNHLCYPWWVGSEMAARLSRRAGYLSNFWGVLRGRRTNRAGDDPFSIVRLLSDDFIFRLPGKGRKSLFRIAQERISLNQKFFFNRLFQGS